MKSKPKRKITTKNSNISELLELAEEKHFIALSKNDVLFNENEPVKGVYFLLSGRIKITRAGSENKESILYIITPPDIVCLHSALEEDFHINTASAESDSVVCFVPKKEFKKILEKNINASFNMMKMLCLKINTIHHQISRIY